MSGTTTAIRGPVLTYTGDPFKSGLDHTMVYESDAIVGYRWRFGLRVVGIGFEVLLADEALQLAHGADRSDLGHVGVGPPWRLGAHHRHLVERELTAAEGGHQQRELVDAGGDIDQAGVLGIEDAGDLGELNLGLEVVLRRDHANIVHVFDQRAPVQRMQISDKASWRYRIIRSCRCSEPPLAVGPTR